MFFIEGLAVNAAYSLLSRLFNEDISLLDRVYKILVITEKEFFIKFNRFGNPNDSFLARKENLKLMLNVIFFRENKLKITDFNPHNYNDIPLASEKEIESLISIFKQKLHQDLELSNLLQTKESFQIISEIANKLDKLIPNTNIESFYPFQEITDSCLPKEINISKNVFFFTKYELQKLDEIKNKVLSNEVNSVYLSSQPGLGKTIFSIKLGLTLKTYGYQVLFISLKGRTENLLSSFLNSNLKEKHICFIITDCHINFELFQRLYLDTSIFPNSFFIFESRVIDENFLETEQDLSFIRKNDIYMLEFKKDIYEKYRGIIKIYDSNDILIQNLDHLVKITGRNFLLLHEFLISKPENDSTTLNTKYLYQYIYRKYFKFDYEEELRYFSTINQYEISFNCKPVIETSWFNKLVSLNLLIRENRSYFNFYHSTFAKSLINSYNLIKNISPKEQHNFEFLAFKKFIIYEIITTVHYFLFLNDCYQINLSVI